MKKIALILMLITTIPTYATTMCTANDTVAVVIDPNTGIKSVGTNNTTHIWWAVTDHGTVYGISACLSSNKGKGRGGILAQLRDTNNDGIEKLIKGTENNGPYCWCKSTHTVSSYWVFTGDSLGDGCGTGCTDDCAYRIRSYDLLRSLVYAS